MALAVPLPAELEALMSIAPTLSLTTAASELWDAIVVGAGPAGALAARELARLGRSVLLVDKAAFPRWKVCGCCLNGRALTALRAVGLGGLPECLGAVPLSRLRLATAKRESLLHLPEGVALGREALDMALVEEAVREGIAFLPQTRASLDGIDATARHVQLHQGEQLTAIRARVVLAADGLGGRLGSRTDLKSVPQSRIGAGVVADAAPDFYAPGTIYMACGTGGYVGLVRLEDRRLDIAAAFDPVLLKRVGGPGRAASGILATLDWPAIPNLAELPWRGTPGLTRRAPRIAAERLFVLGDAASYIEPFTGEGIAWALEGARAVAPLAAQYWHVGLIPQWKARYRQIIGRPQFACRAAAHVLRRPWLMGAIVAMLARAPWLAGPLVRFLNRPGYREEEAAHELRHHWTGDGPTSPLLHTGGIR
jgi:flavin-dependent dehydrogenase